MILMDKYLQHHGIRGMRWGVRRNRPEGSSLRRRRHPKVSEMSDHELDTRLKRMRKEDEYKRLTRGRTSKGLKILKKIPKDILAATIAAAVVAPISGRLTTPIKGGVNTVMDLGVDFVKHRI